MGLLFRLNTDTETGLMLLEQEIDRYIDGLKLETNHDLATAVQALLSRIPHSSTNKRKRDLAIALGEWSIRPDSGSRDAVIKRHIRTATFYDTSKDWLHSQPYRWVLEAIIKIYGRWDNGRSARELAVRQQQWRETSFAHAQDLLTAANELIRNAKQMMSQPLYTTEVDVDGGTVKLVPGKWTQDTANRRVEAAAKAAEIADRLARTALGMADAPTEQHIITADVSDQETIADTRKAMRAKLDHMRRSVEASAAPDVVDGPDDEEE
jgi:hypothetical protein